MLKSSVGGSPVVSQAEGGIAAADRGQGRADQGLSEKLPPWRKPGAVHDPGKTMCDLAVMLALGRDCVSDLTLLRAELDVFGEVASDPTVSRLTTTLAADSRMY
ncbi:hypothetical protein [Nocardia carnea]|uniref:hypothetical protein n=1 Tax=Nocardia carnea TaxID=37328 RepID=UPI003D770C00